MTGGISLYFPDATYFLNWLSQIIDFYSITRMRSKL